jgi:hypothetical protein
MSSKYLQRILVNVLPTTTVVSYFFFYCLEQLEDKSQKNLTTHTLNVYVYVIVYAWHGDDTLFIIDL